MMGPLADAEIIVIGGGAVGCAVAYSLALAGRTDVLVADPGGGNDRAGSGASGASAVDGRFIVYETYYAL